MSQKRACHCISGDLFIRTACTYDTGGTFEAFYGKLDVEEFDVKLDDFVAQFEIMFFPSFFFFHHGAKSSEGFLSICDMLVLHT